MGQGSENIHKSTLAAMSSPTRLLRPADIYPLVPSCRALLMLLRRPSPDGGSVPPGSVTNPWSHPERNDTVVRSRTYIEQRCPGQNVGVIGDVVGINAFEHRDTGVVIDGHDADRYPGKELADNVGMPQRVQCDLR
jgi:hypothetical protein